MTRWAFGPWRVYAAEHSAAATKVLHHAQRLARGPGGWEAVMAQVSRDELLRELPLADEPVTLVDWSGR